MKTKIVVVALALALPGGAAMAKHLPYSPAPYAQSIYCATREAGNPHSRLCDYQSWGSWRRRGGWDASLDNACQLNPAYVPSECGGRL
jgi:hypothetical protein